MNVTFLVGNGFDLQCGLKTSYQDFYDTQKNHYVKGANMIYDDIALKNEKGNIQFWSDFEIALGEFSKSIDCSDTEIKEKFFEDLNTVTMDLRNYLSSQVQETIKNQKFNIVQLIESLVSNLSQGNRARVDNLLSTSSVYLNFITFNYTNTLDLLLDGMENSVPLRTKGIFVHNPIHIHGTLSEHMIIGLSEKEQVSDKFKENDLQYILKPNLHKSLEENTLSLVKSTLENSDIIIIYGMSLGKSDNYIWKMISEICDSRSIPIIFYSYNPSHNAVLPINTIKFKNSIKELFLNNAGITDEKMRNKIRDNIIIVINDGTKTLLTISE